MLMLCAFDMSEKFSIAQKWLRIVGHLVIYILNIYIAQSIVSLWLVHTQQQRAHNKIKIINLDSLL